MREKFRITRNAISIIGGICFILFALVIMFSNKTPFSFLSHAITIVFGFVGYWLLVPFIAVVGFYLVFRKKLLKIKAGLSLWGAFVIIVFLLIWLSYLAANDLTISGNVNIIGHGYDKATGRAQFINFSNSSEIFKIRKAENEQYLLASPTLGGGYVGFILAGAFDSAITPVGLNIVCWIFFIAGLIMMLNNQATKLFKFIKSHKRVKKVTKKDIDGYQEVELGTTENDEPVVNEDNPPFAQPVIESRPPIKPVYGAFNESTPLNSDYSLQKAHFVPSDEPVIEDSMVKKIEDANDFAESKAPTKAIFDTFEVNKPQKISEPVVEETKVEPEEINEMFSLENNSVVAEELNEAPVEEATPVEQEHVIEENVDPLFRPQPKANLIKDYVYPSLELLDLHEEAGDSQKNEASCIERTNLINETLANLKVGAQIVGHTVGPSVTRYDLQTNPDVSVASVLRYINDISIRLGGMSVRFEQIVAGKSTSGLEIPNEIRTNVGLRESIAGLPAGDKYLMNIPFGRNITGDLIFANMVDFPHMLVSGTTGSGKSIFVHSTILTLIMRNKPEELKIMLIDPKKVEMAYYDDIPHLLCPVISDPKKSYVAMQKLVVEMERRYNLFQANRVRDIKGFNAFAKSKDLQPLPYIVVFVDEYADLVDTCKEIREPVVRIMQKARAAGIHMVIATQRPSVNVIDGTIKGNVSTRVALLSAAAVDSMTIIGEGGAEKLLGNGDMLIDCPLISRSSKPRVQGCFVSEIEINRVCDFLREHYPVQFDKEFMNLDAKPVEEKHSDEPAVEAIDKSKNDEEQYQDIKEQIMHREYCSISFIQRNFAMGFSRAGKIFTRLVREGIVEEHGDSKGCKVLVYEPSNSRVTSLDQSTFTPDEEN